jgi:hypothetical protein
MVASLAAALQRVLAPRLCVCLMPPRTRMSQGLRLNLHGSHAFQAASDLDALHLYAFGPLPVRGVFGKLYFAAEIPLAQGRSSSKQDL